MGFQILVHHFWIYDRGLKQYWKFSISGNNCISMELHWLEFLMNFYFESLGDIFFRNFLEQSGWDEKRKRRVFLVSFTHVCLTVRFQKQIFIFDFAMEDDSLDLPLNSQVLYCPVFNGELYANHALKLTGSQPLNLNPSVRVVPNRRISLFEKRLRETEIS